MRGGNKQPGPVLISLECNQFETFMASICHYLVFLCGALYSERLCEGRRVGFSTLPPNH